ncbi:MAG: methionyl-tRNA formyltransferase, partial [Pseudomonadota bacterium]
MNDSSPSIVFAGTPEFAAHILQKLIDEKFNIKAVMTQPDRPAGRGQNTLPSAVKKVALTNELPIWQPQSLKENGQAIEFLWKNIDFFIVVAYGLLIPKPWLNQPKCAPLNVHGSLLPKWRGAAPVQHAILSGDAVTGVSIMQLEEKLDAGPVYLRREIPIESNDTSESVLIKLSQLGAEALIDVLRHWLQPGYQPEIQNHSYATYASKLNKSDGLLNWEMSASQIDRTVRALDPWPGARINSDLGELRIWGNVSNSTSKSIAVGTIQKVSNDGIEVQTQQGIFNVKELQIPGKK